MAHGTIEMAIGHHGCGGREGRGHHSIARGRCRMLGQIAVGEIVIVVTVITMATDQVCVVGRVRIGHHGVRGLGHGTHGPSHG